MADRSNTSTGVYYDPYDFEIDVDPYPTFRRLRDEAPLYYNEKYDFYALSRFADVERCLRRLADVHLRQGLGARAHQGRRRDPARASSSSRIHRPTTCTEVCWAGCSPPSG